VKKNAIEGTTAELPEGFFLYRIDGKMGLYQSPLKRFEQTMVNGTENDKPFSIDISSDGKWIVYINGTNSKLTLISRNGSVRKELSTSFTEGIPVCAGWYRNSPKGTEIFYVEGNWTKQGVPKMMRAISVDLTGETPIAGDERIIADIGPRARFASHPGTQFGVNGDQIFGRLYIYKDAALTDRINRTSYITIPDNGNGKAGYNDIYVWKNDDMDRYTGGCEHTTSYDGTLCLSNAGKLGNGCVPKTHKGFLITPFRRITDTPVTADDHANKYAASANWCPSKFMISWNWREVDFAQWQFSNHKDYVAGRVLGTRTPILGIYVVHWPSNTWTLVTNTPNTSVTYDEPAMYITDTTVKQKLSSQGRSRHISSMSPVRFITTGTIKRIKIDPGVNRIEVYTAKGKLVHMYKVSKKGNSIALDDLPSGMLLIRQKQ